MRTRIYNKMTTPEIEAYLDRGGDTIFLAIGAVEVHGPGSPVDSETIQAEGIAIAMADEVDGLALINLPYFYPGGTVIGNSTVHFTILNGVEYLMKLGHSLVDQGFRRIYVIGCHAPSAMTINAFCRDFFEETLIHPCSLGLIATLMHAYGETSAAGALTYGAYKMLGQLDMIPIDPNPDTAPVPRIPTDPALSEFSKLCNMYGGFGATSQIYSDPRQHGGGKAFSSREELEKIAQEGVEKMYDFVSRLQLKELNEALGEYQAYVQRVADANPRIRNHVH